MSTLSERQCQFTIAAAKLLLRAAELGYAVKVAEWNRTVETEKVYIATGKSALKDPNDCRHVQLLAVDIVLFKDGVPTWDIELYRPLGEYWASLGGVWGGSWITFKDVPHFQFNP